MPTLKPKKKTKKSVANTQSSPAIGQTATTTNHVPIDLTADPNNKNGNLISPQKQSVSESPDWLRPNLKLPKRDSSAGFDVGFPIDTYISAAYILATLSQTEETKKKSNLLRKPENQKEEDDENKSESALKYTLPSATDKANLLRMIASLNKRFIFDLAHNALKYKNLFEEVLVESNFFAKYPFSDDQNSLLMVYLVDLNNREWNFRQDFESDEDSAYREDFIQVESAMRSHEIKLHAALAKKRVANQSQSINFALPAALRAQEENKGLVPISAWAESNQSLLEILKNDQELAENWTENNNFESKLGPNQYKLDKNCDNVIHFYGKIRDNILRLNAVRTNKLVIQEKSSVLAVDSCIKLLNALEPADILLTNIGSGWTALQLALRLKEFSRELIKKEEKQKFLFGGNSTVLDHASKNQESNDQKTSNPNICKVICPFTGSDTAYQVVLEKFKEFGCEEHLQIIREPLTNLSNKPENIERVKVVLIVTECSRTSVADPIELLIQESQPDLNMNQLLNLKPQGSEKSADNLANKHTNVLKFIVNSNLCPNSNSIVYLTRSVHKSENENVVNNVLNAQNNSLSKKWVVSPPVVMLRPKDIDRNSGKFLKLTPSAYQNGCFLAVMTRRGQQERDQAKEMVKKAALQGLIGPGM